MPFTRTPGLRPELVDVFTRNHEAASAHVRRLYGASAVISNRGAGGFSIWIQAASLGALILARLEGANWSLSRDNGEAVSVLLPQSGVLTLRSGARECEYEAGKSIAVVYASGWRVGSAARSGGLDLTAPLADVVARAEWLSALACPPSLLLDMPASFDAGTPIAQAMSRTANTALAEIGSLHNIGLSVLASAAYEELLVNMLAAALFPKLFEPDARAADCGPALVRRARDFLREHSREPVEIARLAANLGVSMRALQQNFQRSYGFSPRDYLLECRLEFARQSLLNPGHGANVSEIALDSGFSDLSHFSAKYRDKYGELPSETLRSTNAS